MSFAQMIRERRKAMGLTQNQLAELIHVSRQTVSHWETERVQPDAEALKLLAEALDCSFTIGGEEAVVVMHETEQETGCGAVEDASEEKNRPKGRKRLWWTAAAALMVIILFATVGLMAEAQKKAEIIVTPQDGETYLIYNEFFPGGGWDVPFTFENVSDVPFRIERIECRFYEDDMLWNIIYVTMNEIKPHVSSEWMRKGDFPLCWPLGTDHLYLTHMECAIRGTDANGNELCFSGRVRLLPAEE